jgi:acylglycerol lipase
MIRLQTGPAWERIQYAKFQRGQESKMEHEGRFQSSDGMEFYERRWEPGGDVRANVVLVHGYGEHCSRYGHVAGVLNACGIAVHTYDQRGFGQSPGKRGYIADFDVLVNDLGTFLDHVKPRLAGRPWFFMGHSMGGLVMARYVETQPVDVTGLVFSSPFLAFPDDVPRILLGLANVLGRLTPWLPVGQVEFSRISRDPAVVDAANHDPLAFHGKILARTGAQLHAGITRTQADFEAIVQPAYIIHGVEDTLVPVSGTRLLHERCRSTDKTLTIYEDGYHELWNDLDKDAVIAAIADWITARI